MIVTYGGVIYTKSGEVAPDFLVHELVHVEQQKGWHPEKYLEEFIGNPAFRKEVETAAYRAQAVFLESTISDKAELFCRKYKLQKAMLSNYGNIFRVEEANKILAITLKQ